LYLQSIDGSSLASVAGNDKVCRIILNREIDRMKQHAGPIKLLLAVAVVAVAFGPPACLGGDEELFARNCASCHGKDGRAQTPIARKLGVKDLTQSKLTEAEIEKQIVEGKRDDHGKEKMPSFKVKLSAEEIRSLVKVVKDFRK